LTNTKSDLQYLQVHSRLSCVHSFNSAHSNTFKHTLSNHTQAHQHGGHQPSELRKPAKGAGTGDREYVFVSTGYTQETEQDTGKGGQASDGSNDNANGKSDDVAHGDRNPAGTFTKGSDAAKEAGHIGGLHAAGKDDAGKDVSYHSTALR
jgi:hypothetical protein